MSLFTDGSIRERINSDEPYAIPEYGEGLWKLGNEYVGYVGPDESGKNNQVYQHSKLLTVLSILPGVKELKMNSFLDCKKLRVVNLPEGLEKIGRRCFGGCESLEQIIIPPTVNAIDIAAFIACRNLREIHFASEKQYFDCAIGRMAFYMCPSGNIFYPKPKEK